MKALKKISVVVLGILLLAYCTDPKGPIRPDIVQPPVDPEIMDIDVGSTKQASFFGVIIDENENPLSGVDVSIGSKSTLTDANGVFFIEDANVFEKHAYIKAIKSGYFLGSRALVPTDGVNHIRIMMLRKNVVGSFDASTGGTVAGDGVEIEFVGGVVDANGTIYTGQVDVAINFIDPEGEHLADEMPGNLLGADENGGNILATYGMVAVELNDASGNELQLAEGSDAIVTFPLSTTMAGSAPNEIPLWHFDEVKGYWVKEGSAQLQGNKYVGAVSHFSFWNCDIPAAYVTINGTINDNYGAPVPGTLVRIISTTFGTGSGYTDGLGQYGGIIPAGETLTLEVLDDCGTGLVVVYTTTIGPFSTDATISTITLPPSVSIVSVIGEVEDCSGNPVANGYLQYDGGKIQYLSGGAFSVLACSGTTIDITAYDLDNLTESGTAVYALSGSLLDVGTLVACSGITDYITYTIDGTTDYLVTNGFYVYESLTYISLGGNSPDYFDFNSSAFSGVGAYLIDGGSTTNHFLYTVGVDSSSSSNITFNLTDFGPNSGDLIEANFSGTFDDYDSSTGTTTTKTISGDLHFLRP